MQPVGRSRRVVVALALALPIAAFSVVALADDAELKPQFGAEPPRELAPGETPGSTPQGLATLVEAGTRADRAAVEERRARASAEATEEREASRHLHTDASVADVEALLQGEFARLLTAGRFDAATLIEDGGDATFLDDRTMRVDSPGPGGQAIVESTLPLLAADEQGKKAPVDLALEVVDGQVAAANPIVDVAFPERLDEGLSVGGLHLFPDTTEHGQATAHVLEEIGGVLYQEAAADTDFIVAPVATGAEAAWLLRSPASPEEQTLRFALPDGAVLAKAPDGGVDLVDGEDRLGRVLPAYAVDSQGKEIEASYSINGTTLKVKVKHRNDDVAYPILVDPVIEDWLGPAWTNSWFHGYNGAGLSQWYWTSNQATFNLSPRTDCYAPVSCYAPAGMPVPPYGRGLYVYAFHSQVISAGTFGEWVYDPPGSTTQVTQAVLGPNFLQRRSAGQDPYFFLGIWAGYSNWTALTTYPTVDLAGTYTVLNAGSLQPNAGKNSVAVGFFSPSSVTLPAWRDFAVGGAQITLTDPENPTVSSMGQTGPSGWLNHGSFQVAPTAADPGLGIKSLTLTVPGTGTNAVQTRSHACTGHRANPCPASWTLPSGAATAFSYSVADVDPGTPGDQAMPEGINTIGVQATDVLGKISGTLTETVKVDRGPPSLSLSGGLWDARESSPPPPQATPIAEGVYELAIEADDPAAGSAPQGTRSGVEQVEVEVDGQSAEVDAGACESGNCSRSLEWELDTQDYDPGRHTVAVTATDGAGNVETDQFTVFVAERPPPVPPLNEDGATPIEEATEFLYTGPDPAQTGVAPGTIEAERAAVIRGFVRDRAGDAVEGVGVTVVAHPQYGSTITNSDGEFSLVVNGGAPLDVRFNKNGFLPVDREIDVPWQDYVWADDVVLTALDMSADQIDLSAPLSPAQVARGSAVTDADGTRQATLVFPADTSAEMVMPNGTVLPLEELTVRATEYTVGPSGQDAMPAELPATSAYTYAAEYSVDEAIAAGATEVRFSQPVVNYTENFLDFPVGDEVPTGYYDRERATWIGAPNGRVVQVLSESGGVATLDVTGVGQPATSGELQELGVTSEELAKLSELYDPGVTLWRVAMDHFTPWDHNWPWGPSPDAVPPDQELAPPPIDDSCTSGGSVIECENQTLGEDLPLTGSEQMLHYRSDRVPGRLNARQVEIPLIDGSPPSSLEQVELTVAVAGQRFEQTFQPQADLSYIYQWDGKDTFGRKVNGAQEATVEIDYVYGLIEYLSSADWQNAWARPGVLSLPRGQRSTETAFRQTLKTTLGGYEAPPSDLGGWSLSSHHRYDPTGRTLHFGDGRRRTAHNIGLLAERAAGDMSGQGDSTGDGGPAREATFGFPEEVAVGPDGSFYFTDSNNARIRKVSPDGTIETIAGTGDFRDYGDPAGDGGSATAAELDYAYGIDVAADGSVYFSDWNRIRKIDPAGIITTVAGHEVDSADPSFSGDDGPATDANLDIADAVAVAPDDSFYFVDYGNHRVRHVGTDGIVTTVAGNGVSGFSGDGGAALEAQLSMPEDVDVGPDGSVYIADAGNARVRRVGPDGIIKTVAGDGQSGEPTWGVPATGTSVSPRGIAIDEQGGLLVTIDGMLTVGRVGNDGVLHKLAGVECSGLDCVFDSSDGALAASADIGCPWGIATGHSRDVYVTEMCGHTVRRLRQALPGFDDSDLAIPSSDGGEVFRFDATGRHLDTRDALTGAIGYEFSYDAAGRLAAIEDGDGLVTTVERDAGGHPTAIVAPFGRETTLARGPNGYLSSLANPAGEETVFGYGSGGLLTSLLEPEGGETTFAYDSVGRLTRDTDAAGGFKDLSRVADDDSAEVTLETKLGRASKFEVEWLADGDTRRTKTDPAGFETTLLRGQDGKDEIDRPDGTVQESTLAGDPRFGMQSPFGRLVAAETPGGRRIEVETSRQATLSDLENPLSLTELVESVEVNGRASTTVFDSALSRFTTTSPEGRVATTTVDSQRRPVEAATAGVTPVVFGRDAHGRLEQAARGARTVDFGYDALGRLGTVTDALDRVHAFEYDAADRVVKEVLPDLREIDFGYDDDGNLVSVTPPLRPEHAFAHTPVALTESYTPPELGSGPQPTLFDWNDDRNLVKVTKPGGREIDFGYDAGGRLESVAHARGTTQLGYDSATGNPASATAPGGEQTVFAFDGFLPVGETVSGTVPGQVSRVFDDDFRVVSESVNGAHAVGFAYDDDGLLTAAGGLSLVRDVGNGLVDAATVDQVATAVDRDSFGDPELVSSTRGATVLYEESYVRDDLGRIVEKVERRGTQATIYEYGYDLGGRLETVTEDGVLAATYGYDANGNRIGVDRTGELPVVGQYDAQDRLTAHGSATYAYDASGQLQSKTDGAQTTGYVYDDLGALMEVTLPDGTDVDYVVDAGGRRIAKKVDGVLAQGFLYGQGIAPLAELHPNGSVKSRFVYATGSNVPDYMVRDGVTYRILVDQLGSPRAVVNAATGAVVQEMDFAEFGRLVRDTNPGFQPFGYAGGLYDTDTGLVRFGARDYDPDTGRFTAKDPIGFAGGDTNLYGYVLADPINWIDPSGLFLTDIGGAIDAVTPDFLSNAAAGAIDGATFGAASGFAGISEWCDAAGYGLGTLLAPGPGKFLKGFHALGINKTIRVDRTGRPIPDAPTYKTEIGSGDQALTKARQQIEKQSHPDGSTNSQNKRGIAEGLEHLMDSLNRLDSL